MSPTAGRRPPSTSAPSEATSQCSCRTACPASKPGSCSCSSSYRSSPRSCPRSSRSNTTQGAAGFLSQFPGPNLVQAIPYIELEDPNVLRYRRVDQPFHFLLFTYQLYRHVLFINQLRVGDCQLLEQNLIARTKCEQQKQDHFIFYNSFIRQAMSEIKSSQIQQKYQSQYQPNQKDTKEDNFYSEYLDFKGMELKQSRIVFDDNLQKQYQLLQAENQKLQIIVESHNREIKSLRQSQYNTNFNSFNQKEMEIKNSQIEDLQKQLVELERVKIEQQADEAAQLEYLEEKVVSQRNEIEELKKVNSELKKELGELKSAQTNQQTHHNTQLYDEIFQLKDAIRELEMENTGQRQEYEQILQRLVDEQKESYERQREKDREQYLIELEEVKRKFDRDIQEQIQEKQQLMNQLNENEQIKQQIEGIYYKEIEAAREWCQKQCYETEIAVKREYEKQLQEKNNLIFSYKEQLTKKMSQQLGNSRYRSKSQHSTSGIKPYAECQNTAYFKCPFESYEKENASDLSMMSVSNKSYDRKRSQGSSSKYQAFSHANSKNANSQVKRQYGKC